MSDPKENKRGIFLASDSCISLHMVKSDFPKNKYILTYAVTSDSPISVYFDSLDNYSLSYFTERVASDSDGSDSNTNPSKKQKRVEERDMSKFWQNECGLLPEFLTRIPKSENSRLLQHSQMMEIAYLGKSYLASVRSDNDRLQWENEQKDKELRALQAKIVELQMKADIAGRQLREERSKSRSPGHSEEAPVNQEHQQGKSPPENLPHSHILAPANLSPNASILGKMQNYSIQADDPGAVVAVKRQQQQPRPQPLMGLRVSPPNAYPRSPQPTFSLRGSGHFNFSSRGRAYGGRSIRGGHRQSRYDDAVAAHRWQQTTFRPQSPAKITTVTELVKRAEKEASNLVSNPPSTSAAAASAASNTQPPASAKPDSPSEGKRTVNEPKPVRTRASAKRDKFASEKEKEDEEEEDSESGEETLRCDVSRRDEVFFDERLDDYETMVEK